MFDSIAHTVGDEDAVKQNKGIKEEKFAQDSPEPDEGDPRGGAGWKTSLITSYWHIRCAP